jgi:hypothetical protein
MQGIQMREVRDALVGAFDEAALTQMLKFRLDIDLFTRVAPGPLNNVAFELLRAAEMEGWEAELIEAAYQERPRNPKVRAVYERYRLAPAVQADGHDATLEGLEKIVRRGNPLLDMGVWWERAARVEPRVCRVELEGRPAGTGFLVGPDAVLTNYHVLEPVIAGEVATADVDLRFGYKRLIDGTILSGTIFKLAAEWLVDASPPSEAEARGKPDAELPRPDQLDYALVRGAGEPGLQHVDRQTGAAAPARGWVEAPAAAHAFAADQALFIVQHPQGEPLKLALDTGAVLGGNANGTRVRYRTNTEPGSSGSPCFDHDWHLVALHHYGDPAFGHPRYNQGVPIAAVRDLLQSRGKAGALGGAAP